MIDEDINERMARLVPQPGGIGEMPSQIPLGIGMTPTFERPNAAPDIDTDYADAARRIADSRRTQMLSSLVNITAVDPDSAARSQKLGAQFGVGGDLAARNAEELRQRAFIDSISGRDMLRRNPVLADYIAQRQFAEIAHDDVDALAKTEQEFGNGWRQTFGTLYPATQAASGFRTSIGEGFGRAVAQEEMASIYERQRQRGGRLEVYEKAALDSYQQEMAKGGERTGFLEEAAYMGAQQLTGAPRIIEAGMMGATAGGGLGLVGGPAGFATVPAGMATGFAAGLAAGAFENSRRLETAMLYGELQPELGHESADRIATTVGIFNAALDTGAAALVAKPFAGLLRGAVRQKVSEAIRQQTTRAALATAAKAYGLGVAGEVTTETVQELNNVIGSEIGRYLADKPMEIETEEGREAIATRLVDTFVATAMGMSIMGAPGPAGRLYVDTRAAKQGEQQAAKLQSMVKAIADNKLLARSPERLEEFAETAVEGTDSETTYVNAAVMHDILRQSGITEQEMDTVLPGVRAQLTEMQQNGIDLGNNDVTVPTAQMTVRLQKTPLLNQILPHARLSPDAMSITEVQQFEANREQLVAQAREIMESRQETDATFVAEAQAIEDRIFGEITAAGIKGMDERAARANAQFVRDMYVTMAARMNVSPAEVERRFPYRVQGEVAPVAPLEQADQFDQAGQRNIDTPEFRAWNERASSEGGLNKLTDAAGKPIKMYHGTPQGGFAAFDINRLGTGAGLSRGGFSFTSSQSRAKAYAGPTQDEASDEDWEQIRMTEMVKQANRVFADVKYDKRLVKINPAMFEQWKEDPEWYPEWDETYPESLEQVINDIKLVASQLNKVGQTNAANRLLDIANERTSPPRPQVIEAYLYVPQNTRELNATVETIGAVLRDVDVRNEPSGAIIVNLPDGEKVVIIRNPSDIKSTDNRGTFSRATANMYDQAATLDADYLAAVERGDMAAAQQETDRAAEIAMPQSEVRGDGEIGVAGKLLRVFHGSGTSIRQFMYEFTGQGVDQLGSGFYFTSDRDEAVSYTTRRGQLDLPKLGGEDTPTVVEAYLDIRNPLKANATGSITPQQVRRFIEMAPSDSRREGLENWGIDGDTPSAKVLNAYAFQDANIVRELFKISNDFYGENTEAFNRAILKILGYDGVVQDFREDGVRKLHYVAFFPEQIKSADPVTYDEQGNVVPLSRRFDITSPKLFEQAPVSPGFYSALAKAVDAVDAKSMAASGWKERIKGLVNKGEIKQDEVDWSGLTDWLDMQEGKVTKEAVAEFLKNNGVRVERVQLGGTFPEQERLVEELTAEYDRAEAEFQAAKEARRLASEGTDEAALADAENRFIQARRVRADVSSRLSDAEEAARRQRGLVSKFGNYTLPGGGNYREVLITIPAGVSPPAPGLSKRGLAARQEIFDKYAPQLQALEKEISSLMFRSSLTDEEAQRLADAGNERDALEERRHEEANAVYRIPEKTKPFNFESSHWDQPNVLVHFRLNDRVDADGKRVLFVEEIQSDWGQAGRQQGFVPTATRRQELEQEFTLARAAYLALDPNTPEAAEAFARLNRATDDYNKEINDSTIEPAPFVETTDGWLNLALKHIFLEATQGNYDRVAFVNGRQSADRYDLSKQVRRVFLTDMVFDGETNKLLRGSFVATDLNGSDIISERNATPSRIEELIGKEATNRLVNNPTSIANEGTPRQTNQLDGDGLKVGGEGMVNFYDKIVPTAVNKLLKKYGGGKRLESMSLGGEWNASAAELQEWNEDRVRETLESGGEVYVVFRGQETLIRDEDELEEYLDDVNNPTGWMFGDKLPTTTQLVFDVTPEMVKKLESGLPLFQAAAGPARGGFDPRRLTTILNKNADLSTFLHETAHFYLHVLGQMATDPAATPEIRADMDTLLSWFGIAGDTAEARLAAWNAMSIDQQRKYHEQFAYSFEVYLFDGKSPSVEMQGLFERFSSWLRRVYKSIRDDLNAIYRREFGEDLPILTGEVRQVMDRMLATEEQIKRQAAINEMKPQFQTQAESGMSDAEWAAYQDMQREAMDAAVTDMTKASLRQMQWLGNARSRLLRDLQRKHDRQRKEVRDEVAEEIRLQPVYRAMEYLRTGTLVNFDGETIKPEGPHRLDMEAVRNIYAGMPTPESLEAIRATGMAVPTNVAPDIAALGTGGKGMMGKDGINPDVAAELFGYSSGDALIRALLAATPMKDAIDARTDEVMLARFSDLVDPKARDAAVQTALHNEARARFVAVELRFVAKATQPTRVLIEAARQAAREMIAGKRIVDVKPQEFVAAEARAARDAADLGKYESQAKITGKAEYDRVRLAALAAGSTEEDAVRVAEEAQAAFVAAKTAEREAQFKARFGASTVQQALIRAKRAQLYQNQLAAEALRVREEVDKGVKYLKQVLRDSNVKRMGADYADQIERILERFNLARLSAKARAERQSLVEWLAKLEQDGLVPDLAPEVIDEANRKPYQEMTVAEFRDLVEAVKQLEYVGKNAQKIKRAEEMAEFNEVRDEIVDSIKSNYTGKVTKPRTPTTAAGRRIAGMKRFLYSHLKAASIARIFDGGKDDGPVWSYLIRTANAAGDMETRMRAEATKRLTEILAPVFALGKMGGKGVYFPTIGQSLNREARLVIALNMGNDGNRQRLLDGEGWTLEQLTPVLESLTEAEWNAVQQVWDFLETYRPLIAAKERRLYGKEPNWVTPTPFTVRTADGKEVRLSGGYYPIKYDPVATERAETAEEAEAAKAQLRSAYTAATTRRSFTKARARQVRGRPLLYTMSGVYGGVNDVIHDLSWHEWLIQANRLMRDEKFSSTVRETYGVEAVRQLKDWIKDNAAGEQAAQGAADQAASVLRRSVSAAGLGFNVVSAALQVTGFSQSIVRVGAKHIARGVALTVGSPIATFKAVNEKSSFMAERSRTQFRELNELRNMVQDESASARRMRLGTYFLMMRMQRMVDVPTWVGAYEKALEAGKDEDTAVALADQAVIDSQGGGMLKDLSAAERGGPVSKLFTVFYSYMNTVYNMGAVSTMTPRSKGRLASDYLMLFVVPVVLNYALKNALTPDVDDEEPDLEKIAKDLIAEELAFLMGTMVVVREFQNVANVVTGKETGARGYEGPAGLRGIGETMKFATQASQGEFDRAFRKSAVNMLGLATGLPSAQINRTLDGIEALSDGEVENPLAPLTGVKR